MSTSSEWVRELFGDIVNTQQSILATYDLYSKTYGEVMAGRESPTKLWATISVINDHTQAFNTASQHLFSNLDNLQHVLLNGFENIYIFMPDVGGAWLTIYPNQVTPVKFDEAVIEPTVLCLGGLPSGTMVFTNNITLTIP